MRPTCTHVALFCRDIEASSTFYARHVGLHEVHRRSDDGTTVVWMGETRRDGSGSTPANGPDGDAGLARAAGSVTHDGERPGDTSAGHRENAGERAEFVLVLLGIKPPTGDGPVAHLGYAVASHEEVDEIARRGHTAGLEVQGPVEAGPIVGYFCMLRDPDGNWVEFSHGQALG